MPRPRRWGARELARLTAMVEQDSLFYWNGPQTAALLEAFRHHYPFAECFPTSSGSAAVHVAIAALRLQPGDEVIVPAITDMGSVIGVLYQQAVPVFADVDPHTYNLDPVDVQRRLTARTRVIMPVHLAGTPCDLPSLRRLARDHSLTIVEDCAQAWGARCEGEPVGLSADLACYSFNDYKHLSCGDGGLVASNQPRFEAQLPKWGDKFYDRVTSERNPSELAPNYRMSEPQAAVAAAQLDRMEEIVAARRRVGRQLHDGLVDVRAVLRPEVRPGDEASYWFYLVRLDLNRLSVNRDEFTRALQAEGVPAEAGYIAQPVYRYSVFQHHRFFGGRWPARELGLTAMDYREVRCPTAEAILTDSVRLIVNEAMSESYVAKVIRAVRTVAARLEKS